jgi:hypothetical protein
VVEEGDIEADILVQTGVDTLTTMVTVKVDKIQEAEAAVYSKAIEPTVGTWISQSLVGTPQKSGKTYHKLTGIESTEQGTDLRLPGLKPQYSQTDQILDDVSAFTPLINNPGNSQNDSGDPHNVA